MPLDQAGALGALAWGYQASMRLVHQELMVNAGDIAVDIRSLQAPISGFETTGDGQSIDVVDMAKLAELSQAMKKDKLSEYVKKYPQG